MNKSSGTILGFVLGFLIVFVGCSSQNLNPLAPGCLIGGFALGALFAILASLIFKDPK